MEQQSLTEQKTDNGISELTCEQMKQSEISLSQLWPIGTVEDSNTSSLGDSKLEQNRTKATTKCNMYILLPYSIIGRRKDQSSTNGQSKEEKVIIWYHGTEIYLIRDGEITTLKNSAKLTKIKEACLKLGAYQKMSRGNDHLLKERKRKREN